MHGIMLPWWLSGKESTCQCRRQGFNPWVRKIPWRRAWQPTPVFAGESNGQRSLVGSWGCKELEITEQLNKNETMHGIFVRVCMCMYMCTYVHVCIHIQRKNPRRKKTFLENTWFQSTVTQRKVIRTLLIIWDTRDCWRFALQRKECPLSRILKRPVDWSEL